jgi:hypothetical protein
MTHPFKVGDIAVSKDGKYIVHVRGFDKSPIGAFSGLELLTGDLSCMWSIKHFEKDNFFKSQLISKYRKMHREWLKEELLYYRIQIFNSIIMHYDPNYNEDNLEMVEQPTQP